MVVFEPCSERKAHEDTLDPSSGLESEYGSPVVDEVELDVASPADLLPVLLLLRECVVLVAFDYGAVSVNDAAMSTK